MVKIRLSRAGANKRPFYHLVVTDSRNKRDGRYIERLGFYNPFGKEKELGVVWNEQQETNRNFKLKTILEKKDVSFGENLVKFINWFSLYNLVPKGMVLKMFLGDKSLFLKEKNFSFKNEIKKKIKFTLNKNQKKCLDDLNSFGNKFNVSLLQGVTGSGKTIVYFEKIKEIISRKKIDFFNFFLLEYIAFPQEVRF